MHDLSKKQTEIVMKMDTEGLTSTQVRLVKSMHALLAQVVTADEEGEYFDASAELLRKAAELIKHASFAEENTKMSYGTQAVEYAVDFLNESLVSNNIHNMDN